MKCLCKRRISRKYTIVGKVIMYIGKVYSYGFGRSLTAKGSNSVYSTGKL